MLKQKHNSENENSHQDETPETGENKELPRYVSRLGLKISLMQAIENDPEISGSGFFSPKCLCAKQNYHGNKIRKLLSVLREHLPERDDEGFVRIGIVEDILNRERKGLVDLIKLELLFCDRQRGTLIPFMIQLKEKYKEILDPKYTHPNPCVVKFYNALRELYRIYSIIYNTQKSMSDTLDSNIADDLFSEEVPHRQKKV